MRGVRVYWHVGPDFKCILEKSLLLLTESTNKSFLTWQMYGFASLTAPFECWFQSLVIYTDRKKYFYCSIFILKLTQNDQMMHWKKRGVITLKSACLISS